MTRSSAQTFSKLTEAPLRPVRLGAPEVVVERRADGAIVMRSPRALAPYPDKQTERLTYWARAEPERVFLAQRDAAGAWRTVTYAAAFASMRAIAAALLERDVSLDRPIAILSGNDIEHALLALAAMHIGVPYAPISVPYSLVSQDFKKLKTIIEILTPGLVFAADGKAFARAIAAAVPDAVEVVVSANPAGDRPMTTFAEFIAAEPTSAVEAAHARVGPETIAKILFTSGSTGQPKGVINTQLMLCANQSMMRGGLAFLGDGEAPVLVDWLPWNHTYGSNHNFGLVLDCGGSLYIDEGKPIPGAIDATVRNLRDIAPTIYFNVPKGFEMLLPYLSEDRALRETFFSRLKVMFYAGAGLSQHVHDALQELAVKTVGERILILTSLGSTETAPAALACSWESERVGNIGLPLPGQEVKLVPQDGKLEIRLRGPNITPGYWRAPAITADAFDDEGFYKLGDALKFADPADPAKGLLFDGRIAEDFKLATGTWVSVGPLRTAMIAQCAPLVRDVVLAGPDRDDIAALIIPDIDACRKLTPDLAPNAAPAAVLADTRVRQAFAGFLGALSDPSRGTSARVRRAILLADPPSLDVGEVTDKGSINQRAVLAHRAALVEELYADPAPPQVIVAPTLASPASGRGLAWRPTATAS
jgi:feruloyl-CoA synthase